MLYYSIQEAAYRLHVSDKTLRRWIKQARIEHTIEQGKYLIPEHAVASISARKETQGDELLAARVDALERRVSELERGMQSKVEPVTPPPVQVPTRPAALRPTRLVSNGSLPGGLVALESFSKRHGIAITTAKKAAHSGRLTCVTGDWKSGQTRVKYALDADGRHRFIELFRNIASFTACPECPHV